jgi:hypothetical protein
MAAHWAHDAGSKQSTHCMYGIISIDVQVDKMMNTSTVKEVQELKGRRSLIT